MSSDVKAIVSGINGVSVSLRVRVRHGSPPPHSTLGSLLKSFLLLFLQVKLLPGKGTIQYGFIKEKASSAIDPLQHVSNLYPSSSWEQVFFRLTSNESLFKNPVNISDLSHCIFLFEEFDTWLHSHSLDLHQSLFLPRQSTPQRAILYFLKWCEIIKMLLTIPESFWSLLNYLPSEISDLH